MKKIGYHFRRSENYQVMLILIQPLIISLSCFVPLLNGQLVIKPSESIVLRDQFKSFVASCTGQPDTRVATWRSPLQIDIVEDDTARVTVERQTYGLRLRIRNLTRSDQGIWECIGSDLAGRPLSRSIQINVKVPITFYADPIQYAELNSAVIIKCRVLANPSAEVSWFKGREKSRLTSSNYERTNDGLRIQRVSLADSDVFWCQADVLETGESRDLPIQVIIAQPITPPRIVCAAPCGVEKQTATLICEAGGMPPPQFIWFYGQDVPIGNNQISKLIVQGNTLVINHVDETDNGRYSCQAWNDYDRRGQRAEYMLNVIVPPRLSPIPPVKINLDENSPPQHAVFPCRVLRGSSDSLSMQWLLRDGTPVQPINGITIDVSQLTLNRLIELRFNPVRREHYGNYTCLAKNAADLSTAYATLLVEYRPVYIGPNLPVIFSVANYRAMIKCQFDSYPPPTIQWAKMIRTPADPDGGQVLIEDNDPQVIDILTRQIAPTIFETQLTYNPMETDFGLVFECRAINPRIGRYAMTLRRAQPPRQVRVVEVKPRSNSIQLHIQPPLELGGLPLMEYQVRYEQVGVANSVNTLTFPYVSDERQVLRIESLLPSSSYVIQIVGKSRAGEGLASIPYKLRTLDREVPKFQILSSEMSCMSDRTCLIKWIIDVNADSPITRSEITYAKILNRIAGQLRPAILLEPLATQFELQGLEPETEYVVIVRLLNEAGVSEQKVTKRTSRTPIDSPSNASTRKRKYRYPKKWVIIAIIASILALAVLGFGIFILYRARAKKGDSPSERPKVPPRTTLPNARSKAEGVPLNQNETQQSE